MPVRNADDLVRRQPPERWYRRKPSPLTPSTPTRPAPRAPPGSHDPSSRPVAPRPDEPTARRSSPTQAAPRLSAITRRPADPGPPVLCRALVRGALVEASERQSAPTYQLSALCQLSMPCAIFYGTENLGRNPCRSQRVLGARSTKLVTLDTRRLPPCRHRNGDRPHPFRWRGNQTGHGSGPLRPLLLGPTTTRKTRVASTGERLAAAFGQPALAPVLLVGELLGLAADRPT